MKSTNNPIIAAVVRPIKADLTGDIGLSLAESSKSYFIQSLSNKIIIDEPKFTDISLSKALNPFAIARAVTLTTGLGVGWSIDALGHGNIPAQVTKGILVTPFLATSLLLTPFAKIDNASMALMSAINDSLSSSTTLTFPVAAITNPTNAKQHDDSESSDPFKVDVREKDKREREIIGYKKKSQSHDEIKVAPSLDQSTAIKPKSVTQDPAGHSFKRK